MGTVSILCGLCAGILGIITPIKWKELKLMGKTSLIFTVISLGVGSAYTYSQYQKSNLIEKVNASFGNIYDNKNSRYPRIAIGFVNDAPILEYVKSGTFEVNHVPLLKLYLKDNKLFVNIVIKDSLGNPILAIADNEWTKYQDAYEFNNDENAIELVTKGDRKVFFHLKLSNGIAYIEGTLYTGLYKGVNLFVGKEIDEGWNGIQILGKGTVIDNDNLKRLFKYPRERYLGIREENL